MSRTLKFSRLFRFTALPLALLGEGLTGACAQSTHPGAAHLPVSPVIIVERPGAVQEFTVDPQQARQMVNHALLTLTSTGDIGTAWRRLGITPDDVVGIKITTDGGAGFSTHPAVVKAICDGLQAAGVPPYRVIIWDKFQDRMTRAGWAPRPASNTQPAIAAIIPGDNYDPAAYYDSGILGSLIWGDYKFNRPDDSGFFESRSTDTRSYYTKFATQTCTKIINVPVLSFSESFGIDGCVSNMALGSVDNNRRFVGPPSYGDPWIDLVYNQSFIRRKVVVHILDALVAQCAGGPAFNPQFCQSLGSIYVGRDPVAIDSLALPRLDRARRQLNVPSVGNLSSYLVSAGVIGIGTTDRRRIQFLRAP